MRWDALWAPAAFFVLVVLVGDVLIRWTGQVVWWLRDLTPAERNAWWRERRHRRALELGERDRRRWLVFPTVKS